MTWQKRNSKTRERLQCHHFLAKADYQMKEANLAREVKSKLAIRRLEIQTIKFIPFLISILCITRTILAYFEIDLQIISHIGSLSLITILFLYLSSYSFGFCKWHRLCIHYVSLNWILNIYDWYIGFPFEYRTLFIIYFSIAGIFLILILLSIFVPWRKHCSQH